MNELRREDKRSMMPDVDLLNSRKLAAEEKRQRVQFLRDCVAYTVPLLDDELKLLLGRVGIEGCCLFAWDAEEMLLCEIAHKMGYLDMSFGWGDGTIFTLSSKGKEKLGLPTPQKSFFFQKLKCLLPRKHLST